MKKYLIIARESTNLLENKKSVIDERETPFNACRRMLSLAEAGFEYIIVINKETNGVCYEYKKGEKREGLVDGIVTCNPDA